MPHQYRRRVYFESTDAAGVTYHADYLSFLSQARVEWAREHGWHIGELAKKGILMPICDIEIHYHQPSFLDEELFIHSEIESIKRCSVVFYQKVYHDLEATQLVCEARTRVACVDKQMKPQAWPEGLWTDMK